MDENRDRAKLLAGLIALLLFAAPAAAQQPAAGTQAGAASPTAAAASTPATPAAVNTPSELVKVSYTGGQLRIEAINSNLGAVLAKVAALVGVRIDVPPAANSERLPVVELGPGPARQILASLLGASEFDYLIAAADTDAGKIQSVVLMPRQKNNGNETEPGNLIYRGQNAKAIFPSPRTDETAESDGSVAPEPDNSATEANSIAPTTAQPSGPAPSPPQADQPASPVSPAALSNRSGLTSDGAMSPPSSMDPQSINQQLEQMYQQRIQMTQQRSNPQGPPPSPPAPANP